MGAATFLASPWGAGSDAAKEGQAGVCMLPLPHTHTHTYTRRAWRPWITLGRGAALVWAGLACRARGDKEKKAKDETRTAIVTSSTFLAFHPSAPGGSFAFRMMKCHARYTTARPGKGACDKPSF